MVPVAAVSVVNAAVALLNEPVGPVLPGLP